MRKKPNVGTKFFRLPNLGALVALGVFLASPAGAVTMTVASPPAVQNPGDAATVCVVLSTGSERVAGTQNELHWDGNCASMIDRCVASPGHGKNLSVGLIGTSGMKALLLSFSDVSPIPDGELYCCTFRVEVDRPGSCCQITMSDALVSTPDGDAVTPAAVGGRVCLASGPSAAGGIQQRGGGEQPPVVGADLGTGAREVAPAGAPPAAAPKGGPVGGAPPAVVVQPPGEPAREEVEAAPAEQRVAQAPGQAQAPREEAPGAPAEKAPGAAMEKAVPGAPEKTVAPETPAAPAGAKPTPGEAAPPVARPTPKLAAKPTPAPAKAMAPTAAAGGSGCNCQIGAGGTDYSLLASLAMLAILLLARRKRI